MNKSIEIKFDDEGFGLIKDEKGYGIYVSDSGRHSLIRLDTPEKIKEFKSMLYAMLAFLPGAY